VQEPGLQINSFSSFSCWLSPLSSYGLERLVPRRSECPCCCFWNKPLHGRDSCLPVQRPIQFFLCSVLGGLAPAADSRVRSCLQSHFLYESSSCPSLSFCPHGGSSRCQVFRSLVSCRNSHPNVCLREFL
jgi:hypothetical protein